MGRNCLKLHFRKQSSTKASLPPPRSSSQDDLKKLDDCLETMDADVSKLFDKCSQKELCKDLELVGLVKDYFKAIKEVIELCDSLKKFLLKISEDNKCLLVSEFRERCQICHKDLADMIGKLVTTRKQIDKKLKHIRGRRAIVTAAIIAPVTKVTVAVSIVAPAAMLIIKGIVDKVPMEVVFKRIVSSWKKCTKVLKGEKTVMTSMEEGMGWTLIKVDKIAKIIDELEILQKSMEVKAEAIRSKHVELEKETQLCDACTQLRRQQVVASLFPLLLSWEKHSM